MDQFLEALGMKSVDPLGLAIDIGILLLAFLFALPVGWDRERSTRTMGVRTFPLVAVAACGFVMLGREVFGDDGSAHARLLQGLMTGVGFLGGGAILKNGNRVHGTATAASIWGTAAIGAAAAHGRFEIAIVLSALCFVLLRFMKPLKSDEKADEGPASTGAEGEAAAAE